jgi:hypothetical protein
MKEVSYKKDIDNKENDEKNYELNKNLITIYNMEKYF